MKLYIKQKVFSIGEKFNVVDEHGETHFSVEGSFFRIPKQFLIYDRNNVQVATIDRQMFRLLPRYDIHCDNGPTITIKREFTFFKMKFVIEGVDWFFQGDFLDHNYDVLTGNQPIMQLRKHWFTWGDSYELTIDKAENALLSLCIAIVVDSEIERDRTSSSSSSSN